MVNCCKHCNDVCHGTVIVFAYYQASICCQPAKSMDAIGISTLDMCATAMCLSNAWLSTSTTVDPRQLYGDVQLAFAVATLTLQCS